jgi:N-acetylglucosamine-6-phosphate deacetylase
MTMHLEGPWLSTTGKKKGKRKFASAEHARKARELENLWERKKKEWDKLAPNFSGQKTITVTKPRDLASVYSLNIPADRTTKHIPSVNTSGGSTAKPADKIYTGTAIKCIGTMHKSNAVPIFSDEQAIEISSMRR